MTAGGPTPFHSYRPRVIRAAAVFHPSTPLCLLSLPKTTSRQPSLLNSRLNMDSTPPPPAPASGSTDKSAKPSLKPVGPSSSADRELSRACIARRLPSVTETDPVSLTQDMVGRKINPAAALKRIKGRPQESVAAKAGSSSFGLKQMKATRPDASGKPRVKKKLPIQSEKPLAPTLTSRSRRSTRSTRSRRSCALSQPCSRRHAARRTL